MTRDLFPLILAVSLCMVVFAVVSNGILAMRVTVEDNRYEHAERVLYGGK